MKYMVVLLAALVLCTALARASSVEIDRDDLTLSKCIEKSTIVVVGTVQHKNYVWRDNVVPSGGSITTDIVVKVDNAIKGEANLGTEHVKFAIEGGTQFSTAHNKMLTQVVSTEAKYEIGEKVMLFLTDDSRNTYYARWPHGRLRTYVADYGKRPVKNDKVTFGYHKTDDSLRGVEFPLELASKLGEALVEDKDAAVHIENEIKLLVRGAGDEKVILSGTVANRLKQQAQTILDNADEK